jgi:hypothetical protein
MGFLSSNSATQNTAEFRSQESGVKQALCIGFNLDSVPH